jgi:regulator of RNase E activity RraA
MTDDPLLTRLAAIPTPTICDAYLKLGTYPPERLVMRRVRPVVSLQQRAVGRARTQQLISLRERGKGSVVANRELHFELVDATNHGDFLVMAVAGDDHVASLGDILALKARRRGAAGIVVDGPTRDAPLIERIGLPVWSDGITMIPQGYGGYSVESVNEPVTCAGVEVRPGDLVAADGDGVIVIPAAEGDEIVALCEELEAAEEVAREGIERGEPLLDLYPSRSYYSSTTEKEHA